MSSRPGAGHAVSRCPRSPATARTLRRRGVQVVGIDQQEDVAQVTSFAREFSLEYPIYIDRNQLTHNIWAAHMIPFTIYVDPAGVVRWEHAGPLSPGDLEHLSLLAVGPG